MPNNIVDYVKINEKLWDNWAQDNCSFSKPITHEEYVEAQKGNYAIFATPTTPIPKHWFGQLKNKKVLCLASGGGQQAPIFVALGADVTVFDISQKQLDLDALVARREGIKIALIKGDMTQRLPFDNEVFDLIFNPVSTTYISEVEPLWCECYRILKKGGKLMTGIPNPALFAFDIVDNKLELKYQLPYSPIKNNCFISNEPDVQFSHSLTTQIGGQLKAGFILQDLFEDYHCNILNKDYKEQMKPAQIARKLTKYMPIYIVTLAKK